MSSIRSLRPDERVTLSSGEGMLGETRAGVGGWIYGIAEQKLGSHVCIKQSFSPGLSGASGVLSL